jgi:hypothetical protein
MRFWSSSEVVREVDLASEAIRRAVLHFVTAELVDSPLSALNAELTFIPVIMPAEMHEKYKEIVRYHRKDNCIELRPHLSYEVFAKGTRKEQLAEYVRGLERALPLMPKVGASDEQIAWFRAMLSRACRAIGEESFPNGLPN